MLEGKPVTAGVVSYIPDSTKGNSSRFNPISAIGADGTYTLNTDGHAGAPPGWYKVMLQDGTDAKAKLPAIKADYKDAAKTPLSVEVKAGGSYDLDLQK